MIPILLRDFCNQIIKIHFIVNYNLVVDQTLDQTLVQTLVQILVQTLDQTLDQAILDQAILDQTLDQAILDRDIIYLQHRQQLRQLALAGVT